MQSRERSPMPRRGFLGTLAIGAVVALPVVPTVAAVGEPDAELIAFAERACRVSDVAEAAWLDLSRREDAAQLAEPDRPTVRSAIPGVGLVPDYPACDLQYMIDEALADPHMAADDPWILKRRERLARMEVFEAEQARLREHHSIHDAEAVAQRAEDELNAVAESLLDMHATTLAGIHAKVRFATSNNAFASNARWAKAIIHSTVEDILATGGAA